MSKAYSVFVDVDPAAFAKHEATDDFVAAVIDESPEPGQTLVLPRTRINTLAQKHELSLGEAAALAYLAGHAVDELRKEISQMEGGF